MNKKTGSSLLLGFLHWLIGGFVVPFLLGLIWLGVMIPVAIVSKGPSASPLVAAIIAHAWVLVAAWIGARYSARFLSGKYVVTQASNIVNVALVFMVVFSGGISVIRSLSSGSFSLREGFTVASIAIFYFASRSYLKNDAPQSVPPPPASGPIGA